MVFYEETERAAEHMVPARFRTRTLIELRGTIAHALKCLDPLNPPHELLLKAI